ncbi:hypothetical protein QMA04_04450 [Planococcus sp. APC 3900]|uniref:TcaA 3rd/4th domain-containing protein n=1 Tax=Planococcus sp. APC 3900 TaxID=3035191 RepID=UPI0025B5B6EE|nr:hypothetical protein [Planococcus sp. APC 3900]MDN3437328.1 hypothetical protein [Planococcus sp. APC 3900]
MKNCPNCGEERKGKEKFCVGCGSLLEEKVPLENEKVKKEKKIISSKSKKSRVAAVVSVVVILIGLIGTHLFLQSKYDVSNTLSKMNHAYSTGDKSELLDYFEVAEGTTKSAEGFYSFLEEEGWENIRDQIKSEASRLTEEGLTNIIVDSKGNKLISVLENPVLFGLYHEVTYLLHPVTVEMEMPLNGTTFTMEGASVKGDKGKVVKVGDFLPGSYEWDVKVASEYGEIKENGSTEVVGDGENIYNSTPQIDAGMVNVTSDVPEAILWIDGKSTEKTVAEIKSFGPIPMNGTVEITAETKNGKGENVKGEPLAVETDSAHIRFEHVQEKVTAERTRQLEEKKLEQLVETHGQAVASFVDDFRYSFESALNSADFSYIAEYFPTGSQVQEDYLADINRHSAMEESYYYDFQSNTTTGLDIIDENTFVVTTAEMFYFDSYEDRLKYNKTKAYTIKLLNDQYYIQSIDQLTSDKVEM